MRMILLMATTGCAPFVLGPREQACEDGIRVVNGGSLDLQLSLGGQCTVDADGSPSFDTRFEARDEEFIGLRFDDAPRVAVDGGIAAKIEWGPSAEGSHLTAEDFDVLSFGEGKIEKTEGSDVRCTDCVVRLNFDSTAQRATLAGTSSLTACARSGSGGVFDAPFLDLTIEGDVEPSSWTVRADLAIIRASDPRVFDIDVVARQVAFLETGGCGEQFFTWGFDEPQPAED